MTLTIEQIDIIISALFMYLDMMMESDDDEKMLLTLKCIKEFKKLRKVKVNEQKPEF